MHGPRPQNNFASGRYLYTMVQVLSDIRLVLDKMTPAVQYQLDYYTAADCAAGTKMQLSFAC